VKILSLLLLFLCASLANAQTVPSSCDAPDSVKDLYRGDAAIIVLYGDRHAYDEIDIAPDLKDSVLVPSNRIDSFLKPMLAVLNALPLFPKDSIAFVDEIHQYRNPLVTRIRIQVDTGSIWGKNLANGVIPTGDPTVDSILDSYQVFLDTSYQHQTNAITIELESKITINVIALRKIFDSIPGVVDTYNHVIGDGDFISCKIANDTVTLLYSMGWGDCPSGCTERRTWEFTVFPDCSVRFDGSYGDPLPSWSVYEPIQKTIFKTILIIKDFAYRCLLKNLDSKKILIMYEIISEYC